MYQSFIGLEIHIQLLTETKIFCSCKTSFGDEPNTNICPVCMGYPGVLPTLNGEAIHKAYLVAKALKCTLQDSIFERKNYFYPDLPKNYQISQFSSPLGINGYIDLEFHKKKKRIRIHDVHLEEDAGKMIHTGDMSLLDYNRTGTPLLEIVTEPDFEIGEEAEIFLQNFRRMVRYLGVCDGNMEEGSMRCDANVSINIRGKGLGKKVEVKNLNSSRFVKKALNYEIERHEEIIDRGGTIIQETRLWNENRDVTEGMRSKETANDYRYFPEPDLPPFRLNDEFLKKVENDLIELPDVRKERILRNYGLTETQADFIIDEKVIADFFEKTVSLGADPVQTASWLASDIKKILNRMNITLKQSSLTPERLSGLLTLLKENKIHGKIAKQVLDVIFKNDKNPVDIIKEHGWEQVIDRKEIGDFIDTVLKDNLKAVNEIKAGDSKPLGFLIGQVMKKSSGRAEPKIVQDILKKRLSVNYIDIFSMGGAITSVHQNGIVVPTEIPDLKKYFKDNIKLLDMLRFENIKHGNILSEEITPLGWASLIEAVTAKTSAGDSSGIIITHGTDTLIYTASLLYWIFADTQIPIVFTACINPNNTDEAYENIHSAVDTVLEGKPGVYISLGKERYSPVNLKFEKIGINGFRNWNTKKPCFSGVSIIPEGFNYNLELLQSGMEEAVNIVFIIKVFPGMKGEFIISLINSGVKYFILELYDTGTANLRETQFSIKRALLFGRENNVKFFCTSQQEGIVDFSEYITSHELWKDGAIPMGSLTTESAYTRLLTAILVSESEDNIVKLMEDADANTGTMC